MKNEKYSLFMRVLHWAMALAILGLIGVGWYMEGLDNTVSFRGDLYSLHKSFGVLVLLLLVVRFAVRQRSHIPPTPEGIPSTVRKLAHGAHYLLYIMMLAVPLMGWLMSNSYGYGVSLFGISMPMLFPENKELGALANEWHAILAYTLLAIVVLHIAGALKHRFLDKKENDVLHKML